MSSALPEVRHVVAWLQPVRWITCALMWAVLAVAWLFPHLDLSLRAIVPLGLAAAICRSLVVLLLHRRHSVPSALFGLALAADAALLTGLLDITGGPFKPFIVMYAAYIWTAVVSFQRVLADCGGNVSQAARVLGIHRRSLQRKLGKRPVSR